MTEVHLPAYFKLSRWFAKYQFNPELINLCASDVEAPSLAELLKLADDECKALWDGLKLGYREPQGLPLLREEVAKLHGVNSDDVLIVTPQEGIYVAMTCLIAYLQQKHGLQRFHVIATYPGYQGLYENVKSIHQVSCDFEHWNLSYTKDGWKLHLDDLKKLIRDDTKLLIVNFPHNPTGYMPEPAEWQAIVDLCKEKGIFLFADEIYRLTNNDGSEPLPSACSMVDEAVALFGLSKSYGLPGLRMGWLCSKNKELIDTMLNLKDYISMCSSGPSEVLGLIAMRNGDLLMKRSLDIIKKNLALWNAFLKKYPDIFDWHPPRACSTGFLKLKGWLLNDVGGGSATGVCQVLVDQAKILLVSSGELDYDDQFVRISFARSNLEEGLGRFEEFLNKNKPK